MTASRLRLQHADSTTGPPAQYLNYSWVDDLSGNAGRLALFPAVGVHGAYEVAPLDALPAFDGLAKA